MLGKIIHSKIASLKSPLVQQVCGKDLLNAVINEESSARGKTAWQFYLFLKSHGILAELTHQCVSTWGVG